MLAFAFPSLALTRLRLTLTYRITNFAIPLTDSTFFPIPETEMGDVDARKRDGNAFISLATDKVATGNETPEFFFNLATDDFSEPVEIRFHFHGQKSPPSPA
jgi:hypothetical protein